MQISLHNKQKEPTLEVHTTMAIRTSRILLTMAQATWWLDACLNFLNVTFVYLQSSLHLHKCGCLIDWLIPFLLGEKDGHWQNYLLMLSIAELFLAPEIPTQG